MGRAAGAPMFADHRTSRPGDPRTAHILRSNMRAAKVILEARGLTLDEGSLETAAAAINTELAAMESDETSGCCELWF